MLQSYDDNLFKSLKNNGYHVFILGPGGGGLFAEDATELSVDEYGFIVEPESSFFGGQTKKGPETEEY